MIDASDISNQINRLAKRLDSQEIEITQLKAVITVLQNKLLTQNISIEEFKNTFSNKLKIVTDFSSECKQYHQDNCFAKNAKLLCDSINSNDFATFSAIAEDKHYPINRPIDGYPPIHLCSKKNRTEMLTKLIRKNADLNLKSKDGLTALMWAIESRSEECAEVLIKECCDLNASDDDDLNALIMSVDTNQVKITQLLLDTDISLISRYDEAMKVIGKRNMTKMKEVLKEYLLKWNNR
jgi:ankyrin repeat protein